MKGQFNSLIFILLGLVLLLGMLGVWKAVSNISSEGYEKGFFRWGVGERLNDSKPREIVDVPLGNLKVVGKPSISIETIDKVLSNAGSPAVGKGSVFFNEGVRYGIDPAFALAFFAKESTYGKFGVAKYTRSIGNLEYVAGKCVSKYNKRWCVYRSWDDGIVAWYGLISGPAYVGSGLDSVEKIIPKYCPASECDVNQYIRDIRTFVENYRKIEKEN